jgi:hypothetical protein
MALALPIAELLPSPPDAEAPDVPSAGRSAEAGIREALGRLQEQVEALEHYARQTEGFREKIVEGAERLAESGRDGGNEIVAEDLDAAIEDLRGIEEQLATSWVPLIRRAEARRTKALRAHHPLHKGPYAELLRRRADAMARALEGLRDARLDLVAIATELELTPDGPVLGSPDEVKRYFETL